MSIQKMLDFLPEVAGPLPSTDLTEYLDLCANKVPERLLYDPMYRALEPYLHESWNIQNTSASPALDMNSPSYQNDITPDGAAYDHPVPSNACLANEMTFYFEFKTKLVQDPFLNSFHGGPDAPIIASTRGGNDTRGQLVTYHNAIQSTQRRTHVWGILIINTHFRILYHTRGGTYVTELLEIKEGCELFQFLWRLTHAPRTAIGFDDTFESFGPSISDQVDSRVVSNIYTIRHRVGAHAEESLFRVRVDTRKHNTDNTYHTFYIVSESFIHALQFPLGRGTQCFIAVPITQDGVVSDNNVLLKDQWRVKEYGLEGDTYARLKRYGVRHIMEVVAYGDVMGSPHQRCGFEDLVHGQALRSLVHSRTVLNLVGRPLDKFESTKELVQVMLDVLQAHQDAYEIAGILHRDMSPGNWIIHDGRGYLIDWELSKLVRVVDADDNLETQPRAPDRVGTFQFMSVRMLTMNEKPHEHGFADDIESSIWVLLWMAIKHIPNKMSACTRRLLLRTFDFYGNDNPEAAKMLFIESTCNHHRPTWIMELEAPAPFIRLLDDLLKALTISHDVDDDWENRPPFKLDEYHWIHGRLRQALDETDWGEDKAAVCNDVEQPRSLSPNGHRQKRLRELEDMQFETKRRRFWERSPTPPEA
ncbi:hypothetical protein DL96DRAFT_1535738 [Flagelloscypha sp. PMI_526]|nr:hypothetical protein DL96DRAFT_1535738 [Flagelloscypha sp. PMI_526]